MTAQHCNSTRTPDARTEKSAAPGNVVLSRPLFLLGFPASGKTTLGKALAKATGVTFTDLDDVVAAEAGMTVPEIFATEGEQGFRRRERDALERIAMSFRGIVALGGGTPCQPGAMDIINNAGVSIWLTADADCLFDRLAVARAQRPLVARLDDDGLRQYIRQVMRTRSAHYARAHHRFDTSGLDDAAGIAAAVADFVNRFMPR